MRSTTPHNDIFPLGKCVHQLFEKQVSDTPETIALVFEDQLMSYSELNARANQLAHHLLHIGVEKEELVAICVERSFEMIIGMLAILKAGAAYVPIDPDYPADRLAFLLKDTAASVVLTQAHLTDRLPNQADLICCCMDNDWPVIAEQPNSNPSNNNDPSQLIYTIYTSGSTGQPKGVQIEHHSVVNLVAGQMKFVQQPVGRFLYAYSFAFDGAVLLIYWTLLQGATLVMAPEDLEKDVEQLGRFVQKEKLPMC